MPAAVLALLSSLCWGTGDFLAGILSRKRSAYAVAGASQIVGLVLMAIIVVVTGDLAIGWGTYVWWAALASVAGLGGLVMFYLALASGRMGVVSPIAALGVLVPLGVGLLSGEVPTNIQLIGILIAVVGVILASGPEVSGDIEDDVAEGDPDPETLAEQKDGSFDAILDEAEALVDEPLVAVAEEGVAVEEQAVPREGPPEARRPPVVLEGPRKGAEVTVHMPGGSVSYYANKSAFQAVCDQRSHGGCKLTRTSHGRSSGAGEAMSGGRPVGFMAAWLARGHTARNKAAHWERSMFENSAADRAEARRLIAESEAGRLLLSMERPRGQGEPEEPESLEGLLRDNL